MRFMMMVKGDARYEAGQPPDPRLIEAMDKLTQEMTKAGVLLANEGLQPTAKGARIRLRRGALQVIDGPFAEAKEVIGGFAIIRAESRAEAIELGKRFMELHAQVLGDAYEGECEVRQLSDFGPPNQGSSARVDLGASRSTGG